MMALHRCHAEVNDPGQMENAFDEFLTHAVVLDTAGTIVFLGRLVRIEEAAFVLMDADLHDCRDGHATKEVYVNEARLNGISPNRRRLLVLRSSVISVSRLDDVVEQ